MSHRAAARAAIIVFNEIITLRGIDSSSILREGLSIEYLYCLDSAIQTYLELCFKAIKAVLKEHSTVQIRLEIMPDVNHCTEVWRIILSDTRVIAEELRALLQHLRSSDMFLGPMRNTKLFRVFLSVPPQLKIPSQCIQNNSITTAIAPATAKPIRFRAAGGMKVEMVEHSE